MENAFLGISKEAVYMSTNSVKIFATLKDKLSER